MTTEIQMVESLIVPLKLSILPLLVEKMDFNVPVCLCVCIINSLKRQTATETIFNTYQRLRSQCYNLIILHVLNTAKSRDN